MDQAPFLFRACHLSLITALKALPIKRACHHEPKLSSCKKRGFLENPRRRKRAVRASIADKAMIVARFRSTAPMREKRRAKRRSRKNVLHLHYSSLSVCHNFYLFDLLLRKAAGFARLQELLSVNAAETSRSVFPRGRSIRSGGWPRDPHHCQNQWTGKLSAEGPATTGRTNLRTREVGEWKKRERDPSHGQSSASSLEYLQ
jgi:hypothetical protein